MEITDKQIKQFLENGFLLVENCLSENLVSELKREIDLMGEKDGPEFFREKSGAIRTIFAPEKFSETIKSLIGNKILVEPLRKLFNEPFYLFQSKFNDKKSLESGSWPWHQDFKFWKEDGMPEDKAITVAIYLTDVTNYSGPIICVPGSHKHGEISSKLNNPGGVHNEDLKYMISPETLSEVCRKSGGIVSTAAKAGSVLFFHCSLLHGSFQNMHYEDRKILMFTFNPISNKTVEVENPREEFMVKRDFTVI